MREAEFSVGEFVRRRSNPDQGGIVREARWDGQAEAWLYRVQFGNALRGVPEEDLERPPELIDHWSQLANGSFAGARAFLELMTYERLRKPPSRIAAAFGSAKAAFYPYQFKPLLKFLDNPRQRLLIVDDVGLGKTIEAGYILRELRARHTLERVLVVVPARLRNKWRDELQRRFDESFDVVNARELRHALDRAARKQELPPFRWITSYEAARNQRFIKQIEELQPAIDLVIFDEAHRMRATRTAQHRVGRALCGSADSVVMLTATPVQTGLDNLYSLLHILDPEQFADFNVFQLQTFANRSLVRALRAVRTKPPNGAEIEQELLAFQGDPMSAGMAEGDFFQSILRRVGRVTELAQDEIIALERDMSELSLTGSIINRTRKVEVFPDRPQRRAHVCPIRFTPEERRFYEGVAGLCRLVRPDLTGWGRAMSTLMAFRYTASCIPAAVELFRSRVRDVAWVTDESEDVPEYDDDERPTESVKDLTTRLTGLVRNLAPPPGTDSKFDAFRSAVEALWTEDRSADREPRKVVVFSYFKRTLAYLSRRMQEEGIEHRHIDGDVPIEEREMRIEEFSSEPTVRMLLSSEVGSEGLDLQFASSVVNYDLPWNPMVVEQRIGRVDRIGQESKTITILNLIAEDTIESRILMRLYDRIGVFRDTIGDIDPILGEPIERLTLEVLRGDLSPEEAERRADEAIDALMRREDQARRLVADADGLMAADQAFLDEVAALVGRKRVPGPDELQALTETFYSREYAGSRIPMRLAKALSHLELPPEVGRDLLATLPDSPEAGRVARLIEGGPVSATFDQSTALRHPRAELLHARHPILQFAFRKMQARHMELHRSFLVELKAHEVPGTRHPEAGLYVFAIWLYDIKGTRPRVEIVPLFVRVGENSCVDDDIAYGFLQGLLGAAADVPSALHLSDEQLGAARRVLLDAMERHKAAWSEREASLSQARLARQRATLTATLDAKVRAAQSRLARLESSGADEFAIRMNRSKLERAREERENRIAATRTQSIFGIEEEEVAVGVLNLTE